MVQKVHFIGIGGIGISALARYFLSQGFRVSGSDAVDSLLIHELQDEGIEIHIGARAGNVPPDAMLVVYSPAVPHDHSELVTAREYDIETQSYPEALGELTKRYFTIAVSGSHGKSTTTSLVSLLLVAGKLDPAVIVGTKLREFKGKNFRAGKSEYLVIEADEWNRSFHNYSPKVIVLTNIDKEHLDTYKTYAGVLAGFVTYIRRLPDDGVVIANWRDPGVRKAVQTARSLRTRRMKGFRVVWYNRGIIARHPLRIPGAHNQANAEAAWQVAKLLRVKKSVADKVFKSFQGAWRRMEKLHPSHTSYFIRHTSFYSDYGHHPTEVRATLQALRAAYPTQQLVCIFEPHQRDRMKRLFKDFLHVFDAADLVVLLPIYTVAGREYVASKDEKDSFALAQEIQRHKKNVFYAEDIPAAMKLVTHVKGKAVVVFMGAGDIDANARVYLDK